MQRSTLRPAIDALFARNRFHENAKEIASIVYFFEKPRLDFFPRQAGAIEELAAQPVVEESAPIVSLSEIAKAQADQIEGITLGVINREAAC